MNLTILDSTVILLAIVVLVIAIFRRLYIPTIVGYILVGVLVGPHLFAWLAESQSTRELAEYGVVFLLFTLGLEFSLSRLIAMRSIVFGLGALQVVLTFSFASIVSMIFNFNPVSGLIIGSVIAMSSTAIVSKQLTELFELNSEHGMQAIGILLFQDLAVIPLLILIPSLGISDHYSLLVNLFRSLAKGLIAIVFILGFGRFLLRPLFYQITKRYSLELLTLFVLLVALSAAWLTRELGLSLVLGAFLAGIMLGETEFKHQIEVTISPFRDVLLALFFVYVGMELNLGIVWQFWLWVLLAVFVLMVSKILLIGGLGLLFGNDRIVAMRTGLVLSQAGEFGFVLLLLASKNHLLSTIVTQIILAAMLISMLISPVLIQFNKQIACFLFRTKANKIKGEQKDISQSARRLHEHVIICGYGRVGQNIATLLENTQIPYIAFDLDAKRVRDAKLAGDNVFYADTAHYSVLESARLSRAKALVISFKDTPQVIKILEAIRAQHKRIPIIVRSHDENETSLLYQAGATEVIPEVIETSLIFASHVLILMHLSPTKVNRLINKVRHERYALLQGIFAGSGHIMTEDEVNINHRLHVLILTDDAFANGKKVQDFDLEKYNVTLTRVRRNEQQIKEPDKDFILKADDVVVLYGASVDLENAERLLLEGH